MSEIALGIDTAGPTVGVALWRAGESQALAHRSERLVRGADGWLGPQVAELLAIADDPGGPCGGEGITRVAVSTGPGAFTGLRVGVSLAMGIATARRLPIASLSSLAVRAAMHQGPSILALLDARKGRVYGGFFDCSGPVPRSLSAEQDVDLSVLLLQGPVRATGEGAYARRQEIEASGGEVLDHPRASPAAELARLGLADQKLLSPAEVQLRYIRLPDALPPAQGGVT